MPAQQRTDPYGNSNFLVEIEGVVQAAFTEVIMPSAWVDVIEYRLGNDPLDLRKVPGRLHHENLVLRWGTTDSHELFDWWKTVRDGNIQRKNVSVILLDDKLQEKKRWNFRNAWPAKYEAPTLNAKGNSIAIETLEIAHEGMDLA